MIKFLINIFKRPFPFIESRWEHFILSLFFGSFVFTFLIVFQPFDLDQIETHKTAFIAGYGLITFFCTWVVFSICPFILSAYIDNWSVSDALKLAMFIILMISMINWWYSATIGKNIFLTSHSPFDFLFFTLAVGCIPVSIFILISERALFLKNHNIALKFTEDISHKPIHNDTQNIKLGSLDSSFFVDIEHIICLKAEGNYVNIFYYNDNSLRRKLLRCTLKTIMDQLKDYEEIKQCHRSYAVNFKKIEKVSGNARNFSLHLSHLDFDVPVSRKFPAKILKNHKLKS